MAWDCLANKTKLSRDGHVDLIEIPEEELPEIRKANKERALTDDLMPRCSENIVYVCAGKTHFVHAQKLAKDGSRTLFNQGEVKIRWKDDDTEGATILEQGQVCAIYSSKLLQDEEAMNALCAEDNLNASVQWAEDEMQAFGRVDQIVRRSGTANAQEIFAILQCSGLGQFTDTDWRELIALRIYRLRLCRRPPCCHKHK